MWELITIDSLPDSINVLDYEPRSADGRTPDLVISTSSGTKIWVEVTTVQDAGERVEQHRHEFIGRLAAEMRRRGLASDAIEWDGNVRTGDGDGAVRWPESHTHKALLKSECLRGFFDAVSRDPSNRHSVDLRSAGYTLVVDYNPARIGSGNIVGTSAPHAIPRTEEKHPLFRAIQSKSKSAQALGQDRPYVIVVAGSEVSPLGSSRGPSEPNRRDVVQTAMARWPAISAVLLVTGSQSSMLWDDRRHMKVHCKWFVNFGAACSLSRNEASELKTMDFDRYELEAWSDWSQSPDVSGRRRYLGGTLVMRSDEHDRTVVEIPAHLVLQVLAGEIDASAIEWDLPSARSADGEGNPVRRLLAHHHPIVAVNFVDVDPKSRDMPRVALHFGPAEPPLVSVPKQKR